MDAKKMHKQTSEGASRRSSRRKLTRSARREIAVNRLGSTGYFFGALQWLFVFALYFTWIYTYFLVPMQPAKPVVDSPRPVEQGANPPADESSIILVIGIVALVVIMIGVTIYAAIKMPGMIARSGSKSVQAVVKQAAPLVLKVQHAPQTKKNYLKMSARLVVTAKVLLIAVPIGLASLTYLISEQILPVDIAVISSLILAFPAILFFALQYLFAKYAKISLDKII